MFVFVLRSHGKGFTDLNSPLLLSSTQQFYCKHTRCKEPGIMQDSDEIIAESDLESNRTYRSSILGSVAGLLLAISLTASDQPEITYCAATTRHTAVPKEQIDNVTTYLEDRFNAEGITLTANRASQQFVFPTEEDSTDWYALRDSLDQVCGDADIKTVYTTKARPSSAPLVEQLSRTDGTGGQTWPEEGISVLYGVPLLNSQRNAAGTPLDRHSALHEAIHATGIRQHVDSEASVMYPNASKSHGRISDSLRTEIYRAIEE